jgi:hypothetical protein
MKKRGADKRKFFLQTTGDTEREKKTSPALSMKSG